MNDIIDEIEIFVKSVMSTLPYLDNTLETIKRLQSMKKELALLFVNEFLHVIG